VSPVERAASRPPLNTTMVLCLVTARERSRRLAVSKFATKTVSSLNSGAERRDLSTGAWADKWAPIGVKNDRYGPSGSAYRVKFGLIVRISAAMPMLEKTMHNKAQDEATRYFMNETPWGKFPGDGPRRGLLPEVRRSVALRAWCFTVTRNPPDAG